MRSPEGVGIGLRKRHYDAVLATSRRIDWLEIVSENFMGVEGRPREVLARCAERWPIVPHGVAMSLGSEPRPAYLEALRELSDRLDAPFVSDHLCISSVDGEETFDLLPVQMKDEVVAAIATHLRLARDTVMRPVYVEAIAYYARMPGSTLDEIAFLTRVVQASGAKLLLDLNNLYVNAQNHRFDPHAWLAGLPAGCVGQMHLAGHRREGGRLLDTHDGPVAAPVWELYREAVARFGPVPTLVEWDARVPELDEVLDEADRARAILEKAS